MTKDGKGKDVPLAPLFLKCKQKNSLRTSNNGETSKEKDKKKKIEQFLMSGLPETLQRQRSAMAQMQVAIYEGGWFSRIGHIQQKSLEDSVWNSQFPEALLAGRVINNDSTNYSWCSSDSQFVLRLGCLTDCDHEALSSQKQFSQGLPKTASVKSEAIADAASNFEASFPDIDIATLREAYLERRFNSIDGEIPANGFPSNSETKPHDILQSNGLPVRVTKRKRSTQEKDVKTSKIKTESKTTTPESTQLWTTTYQPCKSRDVIGHKPAVDSLGDWLKQWKVVLNDTSTSQRDKDAQWNPKTSKKLEWDSDSSDDNLDNTLLLLGPNGCGKTSIVYALAKDLGFKVIEVNAASRRSGKQMLTQLQEATQSHYVGDPKMRSIEPMKEKRDKFHPLFSQKRTSDPGSKNRSCENLKSVIKESNKGTKSVPISLILFEDVDVVFPEDEGFWVALNSFISATKRPIILTSSDLSFSKRDHIKCVNEIHFTDPNFRLQAVHLQLLSELELGKAFGFDSMYDMVTHHKGDLRRCLLELHFWAGPPPRKTTRNGEQCASEALDEGNDKVSSSIEDALKSATERLFADILVHCGRPSKMSRHCHVIDGLLDDPPLSDNSFCTDVSAFLQEKLYEGSWSETEEKLEIQRKRLEMVEDHVLKTLPEGILFNQRSLHLDYLPCLRSICAAESGRQNPEIKRRTRISHYLHSSVLFLGMDVIHELGKIGA